MAARRARRKDQIAQRRSFAGTLHKRIQKPTKPRRSECLKRKHALSEGWQEGYPSTALTRERGKQQTSCSTGKRKREQLHRPDESSCSQVAKRRRASPILYQEKALDEIAVDLVDHWRRTKSWPKEYFSLDEDTQAYLTRDLDEEHWIESFMPNMERGDQLDGKEAVDRRNAALARKKSSSSSLRRLTSEPGSSTRSSMPSDQKPREEKSTPYTSARYEVLLSTKSVYMDEDDDGPCAESLALCQRLLETDQQTPQHSRFSDALFKSTCRRLRTANDAKVIDKIARLLVPSAEDLADNGAQHLRHIVESINDGWNNAIPLAGPRPQPDYSVGFGRSSFTEDQLSKLAPFVGELTDTSFFMATYYMYFPFLTCEAKCGAAALDIADRQNAHSIALSVRGSVELFKLVGREKELDRQILAFSISHDHRTLRIYGYYPVIKEMKVSFYRRPIRTFDFTELDCREKWTAYRFTVNVYNTWIPEHFKRLCSVIDQLPSGVSFELSEQSDLQFQESGLSQTLQDYVSLVDNASFRDDGEDNSSTQVATPDTSVSQPAERSKRAKKRPAPSQ